VVVASFRERPVLDACLASLLPQCVGQNVDVVVARADDAASLIELAATYPSVQVVALPPSSDLPRVRGHGLQAATGELVALTEDHCVADPGWVARMQGYIGRGVDVVGGGMENARRARAMDWGAFFAEYGFYAGLTPRRDAAGHPPLLITSANVAYSRRVLDNVIDWMTHGAWENVVHDRLRSQGAVLVFDPDARVSHNLSYPFGAFIAERFRHGCDYARARLTEEPGRSRWLRVASSALLPFVLTARVGHIAGGSRERALAFARALPFTLAFLGGWAVGEAVGYSQGPLPASCSPRPDEPGDARYAQ
jgi:glycosyltransferase involved in cell wall biosynthesis